MNNQTHNKGASSQDMVAARMDRKAVTNPVLARGWQMGLAMVDAAMRGQEKFLAKMILTAAAKLG